MLVALVAGGCGSAAPNSGPTTSSPITASSSATITTSTTSTTSAPTTSTTVGLTPANGPETVLSPIGLNVRKGPSRSAAVVGTAAQGTVLQVLGRTSVGGGWYKVQGETVTGWISADRSLSAPGRFGSYTPPSNAFSVLFPAGWTVAGSPRSGVTFKAPTSPEKVVITTAPSLTKLPSVRQGAGVSQNSSQQVVACGVTAYLSTYTTATPDKFLADVALRLDPHHALGMKANLTSLSQLPTVLEFVNSVSFPFPECIGGPTTTTTTTATHGKPQIKAHARGTTTTG